MKKLKAEGWAPHVKNWDFEHFKAVVEGYVSSGKLIKPTSAELKKVFEKVTGHKVEHKKLKDE